VNDVGAVFKGRWQYGLAKVLSTATRCRGDAPGAKPAAMSISFMSGFVGLSSQISRVRASMAASTFSMRVHRQT